MPLLSGSPPESLSTPESLEMVIARVVSEDVDSLGKLTASKIQAVDGITRTLTCPVFHL